MWINYPFKELKMKNVLIGVGFFLFIISLVIALTGDDRLLIPASILGGSSLIAYTINVKK